VYYTAVLSMHRGPAVAVRGCLVRDCAHGRDDLGSYPRSFVDAVRDEGTGRIDLGPRRGRYLEWSEDIGFWLDRVPLDSHGRRLVPYMTAAADAAALAPGTRLRITDCGSQEGEPLDPTVCRQVRAAVWEVRDEFTTGLGGRHHLDLYLGEQHGPRFTQASPYYFDVQGARLAETAQSP
jgi:hypothetical protein